MKFSLSSLFGGESWARQSPDRPSGSREQSETCEASAGFARKCLRPLAARVLACATRNFPRLEEEALFPQPFPAGVRIPEVCPVHYSPTSKVSHARQLSWIGFVRWVVGRVVLRDGGSPLTFFVCFLPIACSTWVSSLELLRICPEWLPSLVSWSHLVHV